MYFNYIKYIYLFIKLVCFILAIDSVRYLEKIREGTYVLFFPLKINTKERKRCWCRFEIRKSVTGRKKKKEQLEKFSKDTHTKRYGVA